MTVQKLLKFVIRSNRNEQFIGSCGNIRNNIWSEFLRFSYCWCDLIKWNGARRPKEGKRCCKNIGKAAEKLTPHKLHIHMYEFSTSTASISSYKIYVVIKSWGRPLSISLVCVCVCFLPSLTHEGRNYETEICYRINHIYVEKRPPEL